MQEKKGGFLNPTSQICCGPNKRLTVSVGVQLPLLLTHRVLEKMILWGKQHFWTPFPTLAHRAYVDALFT